MVSMMRAAPLARLGVLKTTPFFSEAVSQAFGSRPIIIGTVFADISEFSALARYLILSNACERAGVHIGHLCCAAIQSKMV